MALHTSIFPIPDTMTYEDLAFLRAVAWAMHEARAKYPGPGGRFVAFAAETGEAFHAVQKLQTGRGTPQELQAELIQAAAMAGRLAVEGDPGMGIPPV